MSVAIIDYGSGNLHSAAKAFERAARGMDAPETIVVTSDPEVVCRADRVVLPGVGAFADCRRGLDALDGMVEALTEAGAQQGAAVLRHLRRHAADGDARPRICDDRRLGWIPGEVDQITPRDENLKIPHMGWNTLDMRARTSVLEGIPLGPKGRHAYFVHSYHLNAANEPRPGGARRLWRPGHRDRRPRHHVGTQFHPEKSQRLGLALIANFLKWKP